MRISAIVGTDSYKLTHKPQYEPGTEAISSHFSTRTLAKWEHTLWFATLQYLLRKYLEPITHEDIEEAEDVSYLHFGTKEHFDRYKKDWLYILHRYDGRLPLRIRAVPEGTVVPKKNVLFNIENEDDALWWLTNYVETRFSHAWYPFAIATQSMHAYALIRSWHERTGGNPDAATFGLHDFGYRGVTTEEQAMVGGLAHLVTGFRGSDNLAAIMLARKHYGCPMAGFSIPASEHSTITSWGPGREVAAQGNMLDIYPVGPVASVSDSNDLYDCIEHIWGYALRDRVMARNGVLVIRPDSGKPTETVPKALQIAAQWCPTYTTRTGHRLFDSHVRFIQGDGIKPVEESIDEIYAAVAAAGFCTENVSFGSGGGLLQDVSRDTQHVAVKCSARKFKGVWQEAFKNPKTDPTKKSEGGRGLTLYAFADGTMKTLPENSIVGETDVMETVYSGCELHLNKSLDAIRATAAQGAALLAQSLPIHARVGFGLDAR